MFQILVVPIQNQPTALYSRLKTIMDWNHSSLTSKEPVMLYMGTTAMVQHSVVVTIFILPTMQVQTRILTATWVTPMCNWQATDMAQATPEVCSQEATTSSLMKSKCFTKHTRTDEIWPKS